MQLPIVTFALLVGLVAAAPAPESEVVAEPPAPEAEVAADRPRNVKLHGVSILGSGCPAGSVDVELDPDRGLVTTFPKYLVQTGPGTKAIDWRKNCKVTVNLEYDQGFQ
jgi:hypothetical protein